VGLLRLAKFAAILSTLLGVEAFGYLMFSVHHGESFIRLSGADVRAEVVWRVTLVLTAPLWLALLRSAASGWWQRRHRYTTDTLLRRWIQLQMNGELPEDLSAARRFHGREL
jgi:hypothetical protein